MALKNVLTSSVGKKLVMGFTGIFLILFLVVHAGLNACIWANDGGEMFNKAAVNYLQSYKQYPKGSKAPDSLLKLSYSLASLNKNKEACSMLTKLEQEFPQRPISSIKRAQEAKDKFQCK